MERRRRRDDDTELKHRDHKSEMRADERKENEQKITSCL